MTSSKIFIIKIMTFVVQIFIFNFYTSWNSVSYMFHIFTFFFFPLNRSIETYNFYYKIFDIYSTLWHFSESHIVNYIQCLINYNTFVMIDAFSVHNDTYRTCHIFDNYCLSPYYYVFYSCTLFSFQRDIWYWLMKSRYNDIDIFQHVTVW